MLKHGLVRETPEMGLLPGAGSVVMFDYDGVLSDSLEVFCEEFLSAAREMGYEKLSTREALLKLFEGNALLQLVKMGFPIWRLKQFGRQFAPRIEEARQRIEPFDGMPELLQEIARHYPTYIITSNDSGAIHDFIAEYGIEKILGVMGGDQEASKVKKIKSVRAMHKEAPSFYYVGDTKGDMLEARSAKVTTIAVGWGWHSVETLLTGNPHFVVNTPEELRRFFLTCAPGEAPGAKGP